MVFAASMSLAQRSLCLGRLGAMVIVRLRFAIEAVLFGASRLSTLGISSLYGSSTGNSDRVEPGDDGSLPIPPD